MLILAQAWGGRGERICPRKIRSVMGYEYLNAPALSESVEVSRRT